MKIAVNTRLLLQNKLEGIGWFTFEVMKRMVKNHPEVEFLFLFDRPFDPKYVFSTNVKAKVVFPQARHPILYHWWFEYSLPRILKKEKVDVFFSPEGFLSLKSKVPSINVLHDINFVHEPEGIKVADRNHFLKFFPKYADKAKTVITVSDFSKQDIIKSYKLAAEKIVVAHNGVGTQYQPANQETIESTREQYTKGESYFLFVGSLQPRKNISGLLSGFEIFKNQVSDKDRTKLLIVGAKHFWTEKMEEAFNGMKFKDEVIFAGRASGDELVKLYGAAKALVYVPLFEGFGLPILEGFKSQVPVITSNTSSMPEVAGNAALLVDPLQPEEIGNAMVKIHQDEGLCVSLIEKGIVQANRFTWDKTEEVIWKEIVKVANG